MTTALSRETSSLDMPTGPTIAFQEGKSKPGSVSEIAGQSGVVGLRLSDVTASARNCPAFTCAWALPGSVNVASRMPPITSVMVAGLPRYGIGSNCNPARWFIVAICVCTAVVE
ncbi:hypothetical protein D9M68_974450 [compost metagenome]